MTTEGTDNFYFCDVCQTNLTTKIPIVYLVKDSELIKFIEKHFQGKEGKSYS